MNRIKVSLQQSIYVLAERGWSKRRIARELQVDRATVARQAVANAASNPALGSRPGPSSLCAAFAEQIKAGVEAGLTAKRIHQDLRESGFSGGYSSVKLFVQRLRATVEPPFRRLECDPGAELQFDFGAGAWIVAEGKRRRPHLFRAVLSHSRKGYSEVVWRQDTETVLRCLENAFRVFGGVPATLVPDNLKAAVLEADWFD